MATYVILSRLSADSYKTPGSLRDTAKAVSDRIKKDCPGVKWLSSYALMGRCDSLDVVEAGSPQEVEKAAMIIRSLGHATTETLHATPWKEFVGALPA